VEENTKDIALIKRILQGDATAQRELVRRHKEYAFTVAYRILNQREDAEEAAQDAFLKAFAALKDFRQTAKFTTWFYRIVFNSALEAKRKQRVFFEDIETQTDVLSSHTAEAESFLLLQKQERQRQIQKALAQLSPDDVLMITLFYLQEHSLDEIANITQIKEETVKVKLHRARRRLAEMLQINLGTEVKNLY
jgi:RNA polymerase sigma factor (sigma-70 family)